MAKHDVFIPSDPEYPKVCRVCYGIANDECSELTKTDCPGERLTQEQANRIRFDGWDFQNGCWKVPAK